ncbi:hypothetical protein T4B_2275 [Trichinella pseudospiralis]|uniref:Uncharacterized protein n=1 Tax=Trichinella pseudospiralis TaxID=6337 RepID=A0A0V1GLK4_TRIPS|nr:hypothetical protein T4A_4801 [Trichinella pseudospiralis]KRY99119.1 hypothetical protein T4B_2275 [Trichinella pseudospiralis]
MHALHYANNDRHNGALSSFSIWCNYYDVMIYSEWRREKNKNAGDTVQKTIDGTKQIKIIQEACIISWVY